MQVENPINNLPTYESKGKDTPLSSVPPTPYKEPDEICINFCIICVCIEYCCCTLMGVVR
jgi:hypothetical protein